MSLEQIKRVVDAEENGDEARRKAAAEAKRLVADADADGRRAYAGAVAAANEKAKLLFEEAQRQGEAEAANIAERTRRDCDALEKAAMPNMDKAVSLILGRIVNS